MGRNIPSHRQMILVEEYEMKNRIDVQLYSFNDDCKKTIVLL